MRLQGVDSVEQLICMVEIPCMYFVRAVKIVTSFCTFSVGPYRRVKLCAALVFTGEQRYIIREVSETQNSYICHPSSQQEEV